MLAWHFERSGVDSVRSAYRALVKADDRNRGASSSYGHRGGIGSLSPSHVEVPFATAIMLKFVLLQLHGQEKWQKNKEQNHY